MTLWLVVVPAEAAVLAYTSPASAGAAVPYSTVLVLAASVVQSILKLVFEMTVAVGPLVMAINCPSPGFSDTLSTSRIPRPSS